MSEEETVKIRFTKDVDEYPCGYELETTPGIADAYVTHRRAAEYVTEKSLKKPTRDKMLHASATK